MIENTGIPAILRLVIGEASNMSFRRYGKITAEMPVMMNRAKPANDETARYVMNAVDEYTQPIRNAIMIAIVMTVAMMGVWVRSLTSLTRVGRTRSNE